MADAEVAVEYHEMSISGQEGRYVVAKVRRLSSPPLLLGSVEDGRVRALARLADLLRCGRDSRNYTDFVHFKRLMEEDPAEEWAAYEEAVCRASGLAELERWRLSSALAAPAGLRPAARIVYHQAQMNDRPYLLARVGPVLGSPVAVLLLAPEEVRGSALDRLADVFRIGLRGQCRADFAASLRMAGQDDAAIRDKWGQHEAAVEREMRNPDAEADPVG